MEEMGWEKQKLGRIREKDKWKEQKTEQQGITYTQKGITGIMTGVKRKLLR